MSANPNITHGEQRTPRVSNETKKQEAIVASLDSDIESFMDDDFVLTVLARLDYIDRISRRAEEE